MIGRLLSIERSGLEATHIERAPVGKRTGRAREKASAAVAVNSRESSATAAR
jgi:hypothetical protein